MSRFARLSRAPRDGVVSVTPGISPYPDVVAPLGRTARFSIAGCAVVLGVLGGTAAGCNVKTNSAVDGIRAQLADIEFPPEFERTEDTTSGNLLCVDACLSVERTYCESSKRGDLDLTDIAKAFRSAGYSTTSVEGDFFAETTESSVWVTTEFVDENCFGMLASAR